MKKTHESPQGSYSEHARSLHAKAKKAHAEWMAEMSLEDRMKAKNLHIDSPPDDSTEVGGHSPFSLSDISDSPLAKCEDDTESKIDKPDEILADHFGLSLDQAQKILQWHRSELDEATRREKANYLQIIVGGLLSSKNPKLNSAGLAFAANLAALNGLPCQREYARQNHISASAISKVVITWKKSLNLNPSAHMKSDNACRIYAQVGKNRHWRSRKIKASSATTLLARLRPTSNPELN